MSVALGFNGVQWELYRRIVATFVEILKSHFKGIVREMMRRNGLGNVYISIRYISNKSSVGSNRNSISL